MATTESESTSEPKQRQFNPYTSNGGSTIGLAGNDYAILAGDTRLISGLSINSRDERKVWQLTSNGDPPIALSAVGFAADGKEVFEKLKTCVRFYKFNHGGPINLKACAQRLSTLLYSKRFFPYQVLCMLGGIDEDGLGGLYTYDPVGTYERNTCRAAGEAGALMGPFLDSAFLWKNRLVPKSAHTTDLQAQKSAESVSEDKAVQIIMDAFAIAGERHVEVGDSVQLLIITANGIEEILSQLRRD